MGNILDDLGISEEELDQATGGAMSEGFTPLTSGVYDATIKEVVVYKQKFEKNEATFLKASVEVDGKVLTFRKDVGKTLKDGKPNPGYTNRLKMFSYAAGVKLEDCSLKDGAKVNSYGKECSGSFIMGMNDKKVKSLVRLTDDTNKAEGESHNLTNDIEGIAAMDGTDATGEDVATKFTEKVAKTPVFEIKGYVKPAAKAATATAGTSAPDATADF